MMKSRTVMLLAVTVLVALVEIAVARSVPALDDVQYVIEADGKEAVIDATGQYVVETEFETDFEDLRAKRREFICPANYNLRMRNTELRLCRDAASADVEMQWNVRRRRQ